MTDREEIEEARSLLVTPLTGADEDAAERERLRALPLPDLVRASLDAVAAEVMEDPRGRDNERLGPSPHSLEAAKEVGKRETAKVGRPPRAKRGVPE